MQRRYGESPPHSLTGFNTTNVGVHLEIVLMSKERFAIKSFFFFKLARTKKFLAALINNNIDGLDHLVLTSKKGPHSYQSYFPTFVPPITNIIDSKIRQHISYFRIYGIYCYLNF